MRPADRLCAKRQRSDPPGRCALFLRGLLSPETPRETAHRTTGFEWAYPMERGPKWV
jgi:hypothetical protein